MKRCGIFTVVGLASIAVAGIGAASAAAAPPICDPGDVDCGGGGGGTHTFTRTLTVTTPPVGRVTGTSIDCGGGGTDCTRPETYTQTCDEFGICDEPEPEYVSATLTASQGPNGYVPDWTGCDSEPPSGTCEVTIDEDKTVSLTWRDNTPPSITFNPPAKVGPATVMTASASDNSGSVSRVEWRVDGVLQAATGSSFDFPEGSYPHGTSHTVTARAFDAAGNQSSAIGGSVTVDRQVALELGSSPAQGSYTNATTAPLSFTTDSDVPAAGRGCRLDGAPFTQCASPFEPALLEGSRTYDVRVTDDVGNIATASRSFVVDRTAPSASFTGGPGEGAIVGTATVTFEFSGGDAAPTTKACSLDGAGFGACTAQGSHTLTDLANGDHVLAVRITDAAGNARTIERNFAVQRPAGSGGGGGGGSESPPSLDSKAPTLSTSAPKKPLKKGNLVLILASDEAATVSVEPKGSKPTLAELAPDQEQKVKAKLGKSTLRSLTGSLREKGKAKLKVGLSASDVAGNVTEKTMKVTLRG